MGCPATDDVRRPGGMAARGSAVPLTRYQDEVARLLATNRSPDNYLAGGAALHIEPNSKRYSNDLDLGKGPRLHPGTPARPAAAPGQVSPRGLRTPGAQRARRSARAQASLARRPRRGRALPGYARSRGDGLPVLRAGPGGVRRAGSRAARGPALRAARRHPAHPPHVVRAAATNGTELSAP